MGGAGGRKSYFSIIIDGFGKFIIDGGDTAANQEEVGDFTFAVASEGCLTSDCVEVACWNLSPISGTLISLLLIGHPNFVGNSGACLK